MIKHPGRDRKIGAVIGVDETGEFTYTYYMQGYETERLRNIYKVAHLTDAETLQDTFDAQQVRALEEAPSTLTDRQSVMPSFLTFNGALFGMFIIAAYIFLDKKEGVIKAYAVTASAVWQYLLSKAGVLIVVSVITSLIMVVPVMGGLVNYPLMILFLIAAAFFSSALGLLLSSFYNDINQAFGVMYFLIIVMMLPNIAYFIPSWDPWWVQIIPTYPMIQSFKETFLASPDVGYVLMWTLIFVVTGGALFALANNRFKQTLTV
jgi:ABC-2 type transport system permease protein